MHKDEKLLRDIIVAIDGIDLDRKQDLFLYMRQDESEIAVDTLLNIIIDDIILISPHTYSLIKKLCESYKQSPKLIRELEGLANLWSWK